MTARLKQNLNEERDASMESADREKGIYDEIQMELETEKARNLDLQRSLDREKKRNNDLLKSMDEEKMSLREELDTERQACRQLKNEMDQAQVIYFRWSIILADSIFMHLMVLIKTWNLSLESKSNLLLVPIPLSRPIFFNFLSLFTSWP